METIQKQIPHVYKTCLHRGIDIAKTPLEVAPGSHTWLGGLEIDVDGRSSVAGLWAAGETAGGIHGGNRIGGSALSASLVFGRRTGRAAAAEARAAGAAERVPPIEIPAETADAVAALIGRADGPLQADIRLRCRMLAHEKLGPIREEASCAGALDEFARIVADDIPRMRLADGARDSERVRGQELESALSVWNLALLGRLLATAALAREESRGAHFRLDFPDRDDARWSAVTRLTLGEDGAIGLATDSIKGVVEAG